MSKLKNIKKAVSEGKGSVKMIEYLLWHIEQKDFILTEYKKCAHLMPNEALGRGQHLSIVERVLLEVDSGESPMSRYDFVLANYKEVFPK